MKKILLPVLVLLSFVIYAQDSTKSVVTSLTIANKNYWRGNVYGDNTPTLSGTLGYSTKFFEIGVTGTSPINGSRKGYGIWMELYAAVKFHNFTMTIDDYYFFNEFDSLNHYGDWNYNTTQHIIEHRVKYDGGRFNVLASVVWFGGRQTVDNLYMEGEFFILPKSLSVSLGGVFGQSNLNFFEKGGITLAGVTGYRDIKITDEFAIPIKVALMASPNYKHAAKYNGFSQNPVNLIVAMTF